MTRARYRWSALPVLLFLALAAGVAPVAAQDGGKEGDPPAPADGPPAPDLRFFPKELSDALEMLKPKNADEETLFEALLRIRRMIPLNGAKPALKRDAFDPVFNRAMSTRHDTFAAEAGRFLADLDPERLTTSLKAAIAEDKDFRRMRMATYMAEELGAPAGVEILTEDLAKLTHEDVRSRVVEALGYLKAEDGYTIISSALGHKNIEIRNAAAMALGYLGDKRAVPHLLRGLTESKQGHGMFCATALGRIEDEAIFDSVLQRGGGGKTVIHKAKAIEVCARKKDFDAVLGLIQKGSAPIIRTAAINASARLVQDGELDGSPLDDAQRESLAETLLEKMVADRDPDVRAAAYWALRTCSVESTGERAMKRMGVKGDDKLLFLITLLGERKHQAAAPLLARAMMANKKVMLRRAAAVAFWKIRNDKAIDKFSKDLLAAKDVRTITYGCDALGAWKDPKALRLALKLLKTHRNGSKEQWQAELALEKMTGHFFGPYVGIWNKWFEKNPHFFTPKQSRIEREKWREDFDKENKGFRHTKETERSVQMGLSWMARHQNYDGIWDSTGFLKHCWEDQRCGRKGGGRTQFAQGGTTGICA
ncbi:MAG: HEAT repeat domain-containing protein, partial [Planctomycetota bacterium]